MPRTAAGVQSATACLVEGGWGTYRQFHPTFAFYAQQPNCHPMVAEDETGRVLGTAVSTSWGSSGWLGHVFVSPELRGRGLGKELTEHAIQLLRGEGCGTIQLIATALGRPVYDRLGFEVETHYHEYRGTTLPRSVPMAPLRPLLPVDLDGVLSMDARVAGEDRSGALRPLFMSGWVLPGRSRPAGIVVPTPWGGCLATQLPETVGAEAQAVLRALRSLSALGDEVWVYPTTENAIARELLSSQGFEEVRMIPRLVLGPRVAWMPQAVWSPLGLGLG